MDAPNRSRRDPHCHGHRYGNAARDAEHPNNVALLAGLLFVLMRILDDRSAPALTRASLLAARPAASRARTSHGDAILRWFAGIADVFYTIYQGVVGA